MTQHRWIVRNGVKVLETRNDGWNYSFDKNTGEIKSFYNPKLETEWTPVPTVEEPKKVSVATELQRYFNSLFDESQGESLTSYGYAEAAIAFMKARMPDSLPNHYYHQAIKDVNYALFREKE